MPKTIEIPGVGDVEFPDTMSDAEIVSAIKTKIIPNYANKAPAKAVEPEKSVSEKFMQPLKEMSVADWQKNSLAYPLLQTLGGLVPGAPGREQMLAEGTAGLKQKGGQIFEGIKNIVQHPVEAGKAAYTAVTERPAETAGNLVKGLIYDPEQLLLGPASGAAVKGTVATAKAGTQAAKGAVGVARGSIAEPGAIPKPWQMPSAREPVGNTYIKPEDLAAWRAAGSPANALPPETPIGGLMTQPGVTKALQRTGGNIPLEGQAARAFGEQVAENYRQHPLGSLVRDAALAGTGYMLGGPVGAAVAKGGQLGWDAIQAARNAAASRKLAQQGFSSLTPEERAILANRPPVAGSVEPNIPPPGGMPPPAPPMGGGPAMPTAPNIPEPPAVANANALGITPPMSAAESGFTQELNTLAKGAAVPETPAPVATIETPPAPKIETAGPAVPETAPMPATAPVPEATPTVSGIAPETTYSRTAPKYEPGNAGFKQKIDEIVAANPEAAPYTQNYVIPENNKQVINDWIKNTSPEKNILMTGEPGTGKTSLAKEWEAQNPGGKQIFLPHQTFFKGNKISEGLKTEINTGKPLLLVADEADNFSPAQIKALQQLQTNDNVRVLATTNKSLNDLKKKSDWWQNNSEIINTDLNLTPAQKQVFGLSRAMESGSNLTPDEILARSLNANNFREIKRGVQEGINNKTPRIENDIFGNIEQSITDIKNSSLPNSIKNKLMQFENNDTQKNLIIFDKSALTRQEIGELKKAYTVIDEGLDNEHLFDSLTGKGNLQQPTYLFEMGTDADVATLNKLKNVIERSNESSAPGRLIVINKTATKPEPAIIDRAYVITKDDMKKTSGEILNDFGKMAQPKPKTGFSNLFEE